MPRRNLLDGIVVAALAVGLAGCLGTASENEDGGSSAGSSAGSSTGSSTGSSATSSANGTGGGNGASATGAASSGGEASGGAVNGGSNGAGVTGGNAGGSSGVAGSGSTGTVVGGASGTVIGGSTGTSVGGTTGSVLSTSAGGSSGGGVGGGSSGGGSTGGNAGSFCLVPESGQPDPCASSGLACIGVSPVSATGTCQLPTDGYPCEASPGCASGNSCVGTGQAYCYQQCSATSDCTETYETCQQEGVGPTGSLCVAETCTQFYAPCNVVGTGDGYCVPFADPPNAPYGLCVAGAPADAGVPSSCTTFGRGGGLCPVGMFCYTDYETTGTECEPFCGVEPVNGSVGPGCGAGQFCAQNFSNLFGACAESCPVPNQSADCPTQQNCLVTGQLYADGGPAFTCEP